MVSPHTPCSTPYRCPAQPVHASKHPLTPTVTHLSRELDLKMVRIEDLDKELGGGKKALLSAKEAQAKLEMENARMGDELDLAKDKGAKLAKV